MPWACKYPFNKVSQNYYFCNTGLLQDTACDDNLPSGMYLEFSIETDDDDENDDAMMTTPKNTKTLSKPREAVRKRLKTISESNI